MGSNNRFNMAQSYDIRKNILLRTPITSLLNACSTDSLSWDIGNSPIFWSDRYQYDRISPPQCLNNNIRHHILYHQSMAYRYLIHKANILIATIDIDDIDYGLFSPDNTDLKKLLQELFEDLYGEVTVIMRWREQYNIDSGAMNEVQPCYITQYVDDKLMVKFIQFLLIAKIAINVVDISTDRDKEGIPNTYKAKFII